MLRPAVPGSPATSSWAITTSGNARPTSSSLRRARGRSTRRITTSSPKRGEDAAGVGQTHLPAVPQEPVDTVDGSGPAFPRTAHRSAARRASRARNAGHVAVAQRGRVRAGVGAPAEVFGEQPDGGDHGPHRPAGHAGQRLAAHCLRGVFKPGLGDRPAGACRDGWCCRRTTTGRPHRTHACPKYPSPLRFPGPLGPAPPGRRRTAGTICTGSRCPPVSNSAMLCTPLRRRNPTAPRTSLIITRRPSATDAWMA